MRDPRTGPRPSGWQDRRARLTCPASPRRAQRSPPRVAPRFVCGGAAVTCVTAGSRLSILGSHRDSPDSRVLFTRSIALTFCRISKGDRAAACSADTALYWLQSVDDATANVGDTLSVHPTDAIAAIDRWSQPVDATVVAKTSAGVFQPSVWRGRVLSLCATALSCCCVT